MRIKIDTPVALGDLAGRVGATLSEGADPDIALTNFSTLDDAGESDLSFVGGEKYIEAAAESRAAAFLVPEGIAIPGRPCLSTAQFWATALGIIDAFYPEVRPGDGAHPTAVVDESAKLGKGVSIGALAIVEADAEIGDNVEIGAQCFIGRGAKIGAGSLLHPSVRIMDRTEIGQGVIVHPGAVLGADGFRYEVIDGRPVKIPQVGIVKIEDFAEIGANTCIDRAFLGETLIGMGTKIDNLVHIAHNCQIGKFCAMAAQVGIAGSSHVGDGCIFWGQVGVRNNARIGNGVTLLAQSGLKDDIPDGEEWFGYPAMPLREAGRIIMATHRLPDLLKRVRDLEKRVGK